MNLQIWLNKKIDKNLYTYNILDIMYNITLKRLDYLGLNLNDEEYFFKDFVYFMYLYSRYDNDLIKVKMDEEREYFDINYETNIYELSIELEDYVKKNAFDIFNKKNCRYNFLELIYKHINIKMPDETSDNEESDYDDLISYD